MKPYFVHDGITLYGGNAKPTIPTEQFDIIITEIPYLGGKGAESRLVAPVSREFWRVLKQDALCCTFYCW
jgi:hypothetical protein